MHWLFHTLRYFLDTFGQFWTFTLSSSLTLSEDKCAHCIWSILYLSMRLATIRVIKSHNFFRFLNLVWVWLNSPSGIYPYCGTSQYWKHVNIRNIWEIFDTVMENCNSFDIFWTRAALKLSENFCEKSSLPILSITYYCTKIQKNFRWFYNWIPPTTFRILLGWGRSWWSHQRHFWDPGKHLLNIFEK